MALTRLLARTSIVFKIVWVVRCEEAASLVIMLSAFLKATLRKDTEEVLALLRDDPSLIYEQTADLSTPLHIACRTDQTSLISPFLAAATYDTLHQVNANHLTCWQEAAQQAHHGILELLLEDARVDATKVVPNPPRNSILHLLAQSSPSVPKNLLRLLLKKGVDVNCLNSHCNTPLHVAASQGFYDLAHDLIKLGAVTNLQNLRGETPLHLSAKVAHYRVSKLLMSNGASPFIESDSGTPLDVCPDLDSTADLRSLLRNPILPCTPVFVVSRLRMRLSVSSLTGQVDTSSKPSACTLHSNLTDASAVP